MWNVIHQRASLIQEPNEIRILRLVRDRKQISRIEIAKLTDLHKATITDIVVKLIKAGFLEETGQVEESDRVGRKRKLLRFRPQAGLVAGVDIRMTHATVALTDLNAHILQQASFPYTAEASAQDVLALIVEAIQELLTAANATRQKLVGIGVGVQGVIDYATNRLLVSYNKKDWEGEPLSTQLESRFDVPVYVENDVKAMALGEYLLGAAKGTNDFVLIWVGNGVGAGIMINGRLLHGVTSSAGEIGFNTLDLPTFYRENFPLMYRDQEMFGQILTDANFIESYRKASPESESRELTVAAIAQRARYGDQTAQQVIGEYASLLTILSINIVNTLNPEIILLGGKLAQSYPPVAEMLQERIHSDLLRAPVETLRVRSARHGENGVILGAVSLVLYELFEPLHTGSQRSARRESTLKTSSTPVG